MKNVMIIALMLSATTTINAQGNSNAQYMGSEKRPQDSVKSVYKENPADHAHVETIPVKEADGNNGKQGGENNQGNGSGNGSSGDNTTVSSGEPVVADNTTQSDGTTVTETAVTEACPDHIGAYAWMMGLGGFILGLIIGFLVKGATDKKNDNNRRTV